MNSPVTPESTRVVTDFFSAVSIVSISTFKLSEFGVPSIVAIVNFSGRAFSHLGFHFLGINRIGVKVGVVSSSNFRTSKGTVSESDIFASTSKWL